MFLEPSLPRVGVLVALPVIYWIGWVVYARTLHPLSKIPGPFLATVSRLWYMLKIWTEDVEKDERALHEKYGPLVRLAPDEISCSE